MLKLNCGAVRLNHCSSLWQACLRKLASLPPTASLMIMRRPLSTSLAGARGEQQFVATLDRLGVAALVYEHSHK